jgi:hypothetical protein
MVTWQLGDLQDAYETSSGQRHVEAAQAASHKGEDMRQRKFPAVVQLLTSTAPAVLQYAQLQGM